MKLEQSSTARKNVLIRCDGAPPIGFGHVVRCLALADELRDAHGCEVMFAMLQGPQGIEQVQERGYAIFEPSQVGRKAINEGAWLRALVRDLDTQALLLDVRTDLTIEAISQIRAQGVLIATIDDPSDRRLAADLAFYPPVPQIKMLDWSGFSGERFVGWDWVPLRAEFAKAQAKRVKQGSNPKDEPLNILVTMGGSDPAELTLLALRALDKIMADFKVCVVLGAGFMHAPALDAWLQTARRHYFIEREVPNMATHMVDADLAVISFGVTAYELASVGVPAIYLCMSDDHAQSASALANAGLGINLGDYRQLDSDRVSGAISDLLAYRGQKFTLSEGSAQLVDGLGVERIANVIRQKC